MAHGISRAPVAALASVATVLTLGLATPTTGSAAPPTDHGPGARSHDRPDRRAAEASLDPADVRRQHGGRSTTVFDSGGYLTAPSDRPARVVALDFIRRHHDTFGLSAASARDLRVERDVVTDHDGAHHLALAQVVDGLRVHGAGLTALVDREGRLVLVAGPTATDEVSGDVRLTAGEAIARAARRAGAERATPPPGSRTKARGRHEFRNTYARGLGRPTPLAAELVWQLQEDRSLRLAWLTEVEVSSASWFSTAVDAATGEVLAADSRYRHSGPQGNVIEGQHPDADPTQAIVPLSGLDGSWVAGTTTTGNNATAYQDRDNDNTNEYQPTAADQHFDYTFTDAWRTTADQTSIAALDADRDAAITQLFYYVNDLHDWLYVHGFDEASGNFQTDNFGRGGAGGDAVRAEAQDGYLFGCPDATPPDDEDPQDRCRNNANFGTPPDGAPPRMQMYMWIPGRPFRDGSMDGDVIAHEYGHGVSNRLVVNGIGGGTDQAGSLGEGWSDTISFLRWGDATVGEYVTGDNDGGIRTEDYDEHTDTYGDYSTAVGSPHRNGEIWAATTYDVREALGLNAATIRLVLDGMRNTVGPNATFLDARDGILAADMTNSGGANQCELWTVFAGRGMGEDAVSNGLHAVPTEDFTVPAACLPTADAGGPYATDEGTDVTLDGTGSTAGSDASAGSIATYEWDLDGDGDHDDATGATPDFTDVGQDGSFTVGLRVTDAFGNSATDTSTVDVDNVAPTVVVDAIPAGDEGDVVTITGTVSDPGWEDTLTATVDLGDGAGAQSLGGTLENARPEATLSFSVDTVYGDDGTFTVTVTGSDDDTSSSDSADAVVANVDPTAAIDSSAEQVYDGSSAFVLEAGEPLDVPVDSSDPGSDDLAFEWDWDDGTVDSQTSLVNPPATDPAQSPSVQPRDVTLSQSHTFGDACVYELGVTVTDDDAGTSGDSAVVLVTGNADESRGHGWWLNQYRLKPPNEFAEAELECYLAIVNHLSLVFSEHKDADSRADAVDVLNAPAKAPEDVIFDQFALAAWLNFANGSVKLHTPVDTDGDGLDDSTFGAVMLAAETVRTDPGSTSAEVKAQKDVLEAIILQAD